MGQPKNNTTEPVKKRRPYNRKPKPVKEAPVIDDSLFHTEPQPPKEVTVPEIVYDPARDMQTIADNKLSDPTLVSLSGKETTNQVKLFLVSQARNELYRVIKLTKTLDDLENKFLDRVGKTLAARPADLGLISAAMETIQKSLDRSNKLITQIIQDESLTNITVQIAQVNNGTNTFIGGELDATSRDSIRNAASTMLEQLSELMDDKKEPDVVVDTVDSSDTD